MLLHKHEQLKRIGMKFELGIYEYNPEDGYIYKNYSSFKKKPIGSFDKDGYIKVSFKIDGDTYYFQAHQVIYHLFVQPIQEGLQINHINGIKSDNRLENLEMVTPKENIEHAYRTGLIKSERMKGIRRRAILTEEQVREIKIRLKNGERQCDLSREFNVGSGIICNIKKGYTWKGVEI